MLRHKVSEMEASSSGAPINRSEDSDFVDVRDDNLIKMSSTTSNFGNMPTLEENADDREAIIVSDYKSKRRQKKKGPELRHLSYLTVGIDLGTSNSVVAVCDSRTNKIEVLECNDEHRNPKLLRSMVGFHKRGKRVVGITAMDNIAETDAGNTFFLTKRMLGRRYEEKIVKEVLDGKSFAKNTSARRRILEDETVGTMTGATKDNDSSTDTKSEKACGRVGTVEFAIKASGHPVPSVCPEQVNAAIISRLMDLVEEQYQGFSVDGYENIWESPKTVCVVSVPANYDAPQRKATRQAAEIAGIPPNNLFLINEPTAAAIHYRESYAKSPPEDLTLLVYDFGGGTLDVTIVQIGYNQSEWLGRCREAFRAAGPKYEDKWHTIFKSVGKDLMAEGQKYQKATAEAKIADALKPMQLPKKAVAVNVCAVEGNVKLGGYDFTGVIMGVILQKLRRKCKQQYPGITNRTMDELIFDLKFRAALLNKCEAAKIDLSMKTNAQVLVHLNALNVTNTVSAIEKLIQDLVADTLGAGARKLCKVLKVTSTGTMKDTLLRIRKRTNETGDHYFLEWPSNHMFKSAHCISMESVQAIGVGAGRDAPDVLHVLRSERRNADKLPLCFWLRFLDQDQCPKSRCFIAKDMDGVKLWVTALREIVGTDGDRRARAEARATFTRTGDTLLHEETVTRKEFEAAAAKYSYRGAHGVRNLWEESILPIDQAIQSARLQKSDIDQILFVGGTTYMPRIRELVAKHLPSVPTRREMSFGAPVVAVASGAARYGSTLCSHIMGLQDMMVTDIISKSIGLKVKTKGHSRMLHMVRKGEFLPFAHAARFHPVHGYPKCTACHCPLDQECVGYPCRRPCQKKQEKCTIEIYEGESEVCSDNAFNRRIGEFSIDLTQFDPPVTDPRLVGITVEFVLDCERALTVMATAQIDERDDSQQLTQRLRTERTEDLVLSSREIRRMCQIEKYYRQVTAGTIKPSDEYNFEVEDNAVDKVDDAIMLGSEDEEEFAESFNNAVDKWKNSPQFSRALTPDGFFEPRKPTKTADSIGDIAGF